MTKENPKEYYQGWIDESELKPKKYDLVSLDVQGLKKPLAGWWNGHRWEGLYIKKNMKILRWKRKQAPRIIA